jgi:transcriptional regulator with XRE-family HTH domain
LKKERNKKGITLDKMAAELNTTNATLSRYENNIREPKLEFLKRLADYFNCSADYLLGRIDNHEGVLIEFKNKYILLQ